MINPLPAITRVISRPRPPPLCPRRAQRTRPLLRANTETLTYTPRESLSGAVGPYGTLAYTYDGVGNRLTARLGAATDSYTYPTSSNRLSMINLATGGTRGFTYDAAGNVVAEARPGGTYGYTYNAAGRMETFSINGFLQAQYKYDAMGRQAIRTLTSPTAVTIHSVFDSDGRRIAEYNETSGALIREYVWHGWDPIAVIEGGVVSFVRADHIGRPVFATNATGVKTWTATYTPFGGVHTSTGAPPSARFPGQWFQSESGLHQNWMRDYDPTTGRYLQADPLGLVDGASVYGYVRQSPMRFIDPTGEAIPAVVWGAIRLAAYAYTAYQLYCAEEWEDYFWIILDNLNPSKRLCPICKGFGGGKGGPPDLGHNSGLPDKRYSPEKEALVDMAKADKRSGVTREDMDAYRELNQELPDPFPPNKVRIDEGHAGRGPHSEVPHGHVGPIDHIHIIDP